MKRIDMKHGARMNPDHPALKDNWRRIRSEAARKGWSTRRKQQTEALIDEQNRKALASLGAFMKALRKKGVISDVSNQG